MEPVSFSLNDLDEFLVKASKATYAGGGKFERQPERKGFAELTFTDGDWFYRDSFTGWFRSRGMEIVRYKNTPVWSALYGGGVKDRDAEYARQVFDFLKKALSVDNKGFRSFRGPQNLRLGRWEYKYKQEGDIQEFWGHEEIYWQKGQVFEHRIIGGLIVHKADKKPAIYESY